MYSPQMNRARLINQQGHQQGFPQGSGSHNFVMKQKLESLQNQRPMGPPQQQQGQIQVQGPQIQQPLNANVPPGLNVMQQNAPGMNRFMNNQQIPKQMNMMAGGNNMNVGGAVGINQGNSIQQNILPPPNHLFIREVWSGNLHSEFQYIRKAIQQYNQVSVSTEFVGTLARPIGNFRSKTDYHYQTMRSNVDLLNPIQIGISVCDANGKKPDNGPSTWQFNFNFDVANELISGDSLELLKKSGINFDQHKTNGIDIFEFAQLMMDSGLVLNKEVTWITFHAAYDFGFLIHLLMNELMPNNMKDYEWWINKYIPNFYDLNLIYKVIHDFKEQQQQQQQQQANAQNSSQQLTLTSLADELGFPRFPLFTSTGGQSLLSLLAFSQLDKISMHKLPNGADFESYKNLIYGINSE